MKTIKELMEEVNNDRNEIFKNIFRARLKEIREEKEFSQKTVAEKLGVAVSTYANWEQGRTEPSIYDIFNLIYVYEIEANDLFDVKGITE